MNHGGDIANLDGPLPPHPQQGWLDLSTGIAPFPYPFTPLAPDFWQKLPQKARLSLLLKAARKAYGAPSDAEIIAAPGTQSLIQLLPLLKQPAKVAIAGPTYTEHAMCWQRFGAEVTMLDGCELPDNIDVMVVCNPNNPDGRIWDKGLLLRSADNLGARGGFLVVDEAFADVMPQISLAPYCGHRGLIVLRSFGKFFGLAGVRLGFALGPDDRLQKLAEHLGPWAVSGPAIETGIEALQDEAWAAGARALYDRLALRLDTILSQMGFTVVGGTSLFRLARHDKAAAIHARLLREGILARRFDDQPECLRFGLPGHERDFIRLEAALAG